MAAFDSLFRRVYLFSHKESATVLLATSQRAALMLSVSQKSKARATFALFFNESSLSFSMMTALGSQTALRLVKEPWYSILLSHL